MIATNSASTLQTASAAKVWHVAQSTELSALTDIYQEEINIAIWQRKLSKKLQDSVNEFLTLQPKFQMAMIVTPKSVLSTLKDLIGEESQVELIEN